MATTALGDVPGNTSGELPEVGSKAPGFTLVGEDLSEFTLDDLSGRTVLNIFPSIGTGVCQASVRRFNELAGGLENTTVVDVSVDLPFAQAGFCAAEGLENVKVGSAFRSSFAEDYGVRMVDTKFQGLLASRRRRGRRGRHRPAHRARPPDRPGARLRRGVGRARLTDAVHQPAHHPVVVPHQHRLRDVRRDDECGATARTCCSNSTSVYLADGDSSSKRALPRIGPSMPTSRTSRSRDRAVSTRSRS